MSKPLDLELIEKLWNESESHEDQAFVAENWLIPLIGEVEQLRKDLSDAQWRISQ